jgi:hypothetical protein
LGGQSISNLLLTIIPVVIFLGMTLIIFGVVSLFRAGEKGRRSPLTSELLRSPGESLRAQIEDISLNVDSLLVVIVTIPVVVYSTYLSQMYFVSNKQSSFSIIIYLLLGGLPTLFWVVKIWRLLKQRRYLYLGLDCELAVGQELNHLMLKGCRVYHDFPADKFNIDHVVVSQKGVFAVETKGRAKPDKKMGSGDATVIYDGQVLRFPGWSETEPLDQAKRQAVWLSQWLSSAVGEQIAVKPVLSLPGWFIERKKPSPDLILFNGKNPDLLLKWAASISLSEALVQRVVHQLEQRCRDVEPSAYKRS